MKDVAALAGVAIKTVARVMNGDPTVAPDLAARVRDAAGKLGYRPNLTASSLRRGDRRTATIGLLLEDVAEPFPAAVLRAAEDVAWDDRPD
jgi:LacI family transcriptional regulator